MIGSSLGPYRIVKRLGAGAYGEVYLAEDTRLRRRVAVKRLRALEGTGLGDARRRLMREARAAARLNHPNIAAVYDVMDAPDVVSIVMEYVPGETLADRLLTGPLPPWTVFEIGTQLADGLAEAHSLGVVHRDLKPGNVVLTPTGKVKILDFGLARSYALELGSVQLESSHGTVERGIVIGTLPYVPPEHLEGHPVDRQGDIYSLGVVLFELLTRQRPFHGDTAGHLKKAIIAQPTPRASTRNPAVPASLDAIVFRAMARNPADRYASAGEMASDLKRAAAAVTDADTRSVPSAWARVSGWRARIAAAAVAAVLALATALFLPCTASEDRWSVAVLPLRNLSADLENDYFSDGMTEEIIAQLYKVRDLKVIAATSAMAYKGSQRSANEIGRELGVATLLEGSVRRAGNQVRIVTQLTQSRTGEKVWVEVYDREMRDIFAIQSDVATRIAVALKGELSAAEQKSLQHRRADDLEAFNLYLQGRYHWNKRTQDELTQSIDYFQRAIARDPSYARAYVGLADTYHLLGLYGFRPWRSTARLAWAAATKALELDDTLAEAHASLALARHQEFDWIGAESAFKRSLELNPSYATAHHWYANYLAQLGRFDDALAEAKRAQQLDPLSVSITTAMGQVLYLARRHDRAIDQLRLALVMNAGFDAAHIILADALTQKGSYDEALAEVEKAAHLSSAQRRALAAYVHAVAGDRVRARGILDEVTAARNEGADPAATSIAAVHAALQEKDRALEWLERAVSEGDLWTAYLKVEPRFDILRSHPRFLRLLSSLRLDD